MAGTTRLSGYLCRCREYPAGCWQLHDPKPRDDDEFKYNLDGLLAFSFNPSWYTLPSVNIMSRLSKLHNWIKVEETEEMKESKGHLWTNADLAPNPPETRKWDSWSFFLFQVSQLAG